MLKFPAFGPGTLSASAALFIVAALNGALWTQLYGALTPRTVPDWAFLASFFLCQIAGYYFCLRALAFPFLLKTSGVILVVIAAAASHFMREYGVVIDGNMIRNVLQTDPAEARDLITWASFYWLLGMGALPAIGIIYAPIRWPEWRPLLFGNFRGCAVALAFIGVNFAAFSGDYFSVLREQQAIVFTSTPGNVLVAGGKIAVHSLRHYSGPIEPIGTDARHERASSGHERPLVTVLVIGETARAGSFSLFGYHRDTNPELRSISDLIAFQKVSSCGTDTGTSVPCIFSGLGRARYSLRAVQRRENLLDVIQRAGFQVTWVDNQGGCKGVCARIPTENVAKSTDARFCGDGECHDEILLQGLEQRIESMSKGGIGGVIVLHMMGSHGPAYYKRVPSAFVRFKPICDTAQFSKCTNEQIVNSYDNTIAYTDHVLSALISLLRKASEGGVDASLLYVSDHGESLGENGVYLHAMPYFMAPEEQTRVPLVMWLSRGVRETLQVQDECLADLAQTQTFSHDNVFHTVLGLNRIRTSVYDARLDIISQCRDRRRRPA